MTVNIVSAFARLLKVLFLSLFLLLCLSTAAQAQMRQPDLEFDLHEDNGSPYGIWSNRTTMWVADWWDEKLYAYRLTGSNRGSRDDTQDIDLHDDNSLPDGIWSNGTTMWVADWSDDKLYAYTLSSRSRDDTQDIDLHNVNTRPEGIWSNRTTMWVADSDDDKLYAYRLTGSNRGSRDDTQDIDLHEDNGSPEGIWSNRTTMWVADSRDDKVFAYRLSDGRRIRAQEIDLHEDNGSPQGIWSDSTSVWVADWRDEKLYAYTLPPFPTSTDASLSALAISQGENTLSPAFVADTLSYTAGVVHGVTSITVTPTGTEDSASITVNGNDVNSGEASDAIALNAGPNTITIVVTSPDLSTERSYTLTVTHTDGVTDVSSVTDDGSYRSGADIDITVTFSGNVNVNGTPQLTLATGMTNRMAAYTGGTGSAILTFRYTVQDGDSSTDLNYANTMSLQLSDGDTITDDAGNPAVLTLPAPDSDDSLAGNAAIVIDTTAPTVSIIAPPRAGSAFPAMFTFSEDMTGFDMSDIMVTGGRASNFIRVDPRQYTATITAPSADTPVTLDVAAGAATDVAGNENTVATRVAVAFGAITVSPASVTTTEAAGTERTANFEVSLNQAPATDETVTIRVESSDTTEGTVVPGSLTFTATNYSMARTVTVTGIDDAIDDGDMVYNIALMATSSDTNSDLRGELNRVRVTHSDDDSRGITIMPTTLYVIVGTTGEYTVKLDTEPTGNVTIIPSNSTITARVSGALTFTTANWDTPQTVTVTGTTANWDTPQTVTVTGGGDDSVTISHTVEGAGTDYSSVMARDVRVTVSIFSASDINRDGVVDDNDALLVFYGLRYGDALRLLDEQRRILLRGVCGLCPNDEELLRMIDRAEAWVNHSRYDINQDGVVNDQDALIIFYGMRFRAALILLDEQRRILIGGLLPERINTDEERLRVIREAGNVFRR